MSDNTEKPCHKCGHDFNAHMLKGYGSPPTEGWMECPVEGCKCDMTWSLGKNFDSKSNETNT